MKWLAYMLGLALAFSPNCAVAVELSGAPANSAAIAKIDLNSLMKGPFRADAMELARATMPEKQFHAMLIASLERGLREGIGDGASDLEKTSPGIVSELQAAVRDATTDMRARIYRTTLERYARLYTQALTPAETAELMQFYRTPTGMKLIAAKYATLGSADIPLDRDTTDQDIKDVNRQAVGSALSHMDDADKAELMKFASLPAFPKLRALAPIVTKLEAEMANEGDPDAEKAIASAVAAVMKRRGIGD